jgi:hypothetical protein
MWANRCTRSSFTDWMLFHIEATRWDLYDVIGVLKVVGGSLDLVLLAMT